jgi:hypothetical protein
LSLVNETETTPYKGLFFENKKQGGSGLQHYIMKKRMTIIITSCLLFSCIVPYKTEAASGTITGSSAYAWGENFGWINFHTNQSNITVTDTAVTGYAWSSIYGWINLSPTTGGVTNTCQGILGGHAWSISRGWINFSGATINADGKFTGTIGTAGSKAGRINFDCTHCSVTTSWRHCPASVTPTSIAPTSIAPTATPGPASSISQTPTPSVSVSSNWQTAQTPSNIDISSMPQESGIPVQNKSKNDEQLNGSNSKNAGTALLQQVFRLLGFSTHDSSISAAWLQRPFMVLGSTAPVVLPVGLSVFALFFIFFWHRNKKEKHRK